MKRYTVFTLFTSDCIVWDNLQDQPVHNSTKATRALAQAAADRMNADYELAMERARKRAFAAPVTYGPKKLLGKFL